MALTSLALAITVDVKVTDEAGVRVALPDTVGPWTGAQLLYCQNSECRKEWQLDELDDPEVCPECGGELASMTISEKKLLPGDTVILKKRYMRPGDPRPLFVSIVLSGKERASIHRPQVCLVGQGREITDSEVLEVPLEERKPLDVMMLNLLTTVSGRKEQSTRMGQFYAYWFVGKGRETPYHVERMIWMAYDRIFRNVAHRWAYISVSGVRDLDSREHYEIVQEFVHDLYPQMAIDS
jgi:hypothetical protein